MMLAETLAFVTVVRTGSFTAAGLKLGVPKSTLSRQVSRLEQQLGARLLQRTTRKLSMTELGLAYYERCYPAIDEIEQAERVAMDVSGIPKGRLKISAPVDLVHRELSALLPEFHRRYPEIELALIVTQDRLDLVAEGIDVAIRGGDPPDSGFVARKIAPSKVLLCAAPDYLDRRGRPARPEDLRDHDFVSMGRGARALDRIPGPEGPVALPAGWLTANDWSVVLDAVVAGMGIGPMIIQWAREPLQQGRLEHVLPAIGVETGGLYAVYPSRHHLTPKVRVFVDYLVETLRPRLSAPA